MKKRIFYFFLLLTSVPIFSQDNYQWQGKFEQLTPQLPTPNAYRAADGAPGPDYWQQRADYQIAVRLDDNRQRISGKETITYYNNSPQPLDYLWLQLEQNRRAPHNEEKLTKNFGIGSDSIFSKMWMYHLKLRTRNCGMNITAVTDENKHPLPYSIQKTMMRIDLPQTLQPGEQISFNVEWWYDLNNRMEEFGRGGFEYFPEDENYLYTVAQFYPRMAVYDDAEGWQHKQFLGAGEFALSFGNFDVKITTPADHLLMATGTLQNAKKVLSETEYKYLLKAKKSFDKPIVIATEAEAREREKSRSKKNKTWHFKAENVRDFAFASSRKFIWDAQAVRLNGRDVLAQSLYPKEGNPLWEKESTKAVINTLKTYSKYSVDYPYPVATSVHAASIGMEYPMICFNFGRPYPDGTYPDAIKYGMIGVIIHEVGHNFFPMIVNSDERQWTWMDEGLNTFLEYLTEKECYKNYPFDRGPATTIVDYMKLDKKYLRPIMTNSEQVLHLGDNAYGKPAAALNILREVVLGHEAFDMAFKTYAQRWAFKHPKPADFFRCMEDASGVDLDWFWRGWFYTTDHVDIAIDTVIWYRVKGNEAIALQEIPDAKGGPNSAVEPVELTDPAIFTIVETPDIYYGEFRERLDEKALLNQFENKEIYQVKFSNLGGLVMPLLLEFELESGKKEKITIPAEIWRYAENKASKLFYFDEKVVAVKMDPELLTADTDTYNNVFPRVRQASRFEEFKEKK